MRLSRIIKLFLSLSLSLGLMSAPVPPRVVEASEVSRVAHAKELLGSHYFKSIVRDAEKSGSEIEVYMDGWIRRALPKKWKIHSRKISKTIVTESKKYGFDPAFLLAVIQSESTFNPARVGGVGELGLMQIRPSTGKWIAKKYKLSWKSNKTLLDPVQNIKIGAAYFAMLRESFDQHSRLYLAAYNMGPSNVYYAISQNVWPQDYPKRVMAEYLSFYRDLRDDLLDKKNSES